MLLRLKGFFSTLPREKKILCIEQLKHDFGDFPPYPLKSMDQPEGCFTVKYINQRARIWSDIAGFYSLMKDATFNNSDEYISGSLTLLGVDEIFREAIIEINNFKGIFLELRFYKKFLFTILMLIIIPFITVLFIYKISKSMFNIARKSNSMESLGGYFSLLPCNKDKIFIKHDNATDSRNNSDSIISHEHIHLLQARARVEDRDYAICSDLYKNPLVIFEEEKAGKFILYLLERRELEARLHEVIISFYRVHGELPMTIASLTKALLLNTEITDELFQYLLCNVINDGSLKSSELYSTRESLIGRQIFSLLVTIKSHSLSVRFITEVIPVMYSNLLRYYGDINASHHFGNQIQRPNLYDQIYG